MLKKISDYCFYSSWCELFYTLARPFITPSESVTFNGVQFARPSYQANNTKTSSFWYCCCCWRFFLQTGYYFHCDFINIIEVYFLTSSSSHTPLTNEQFVHVCARVCVCSVNCQLLLYISVYLCTLFSLFLNAELPFLFARFVYDSFLHTFKVRAHKDTMKSKANRADAAHSAPDEQVFFIFASFEQLEQSAKDGKWRKREIRQ